MSKAMDGAERKGREAAMAGLKRSANPYGDVRADYRNSATWSRAFQRRWFEGFDKYKSERKAERASNYHGDCDGDASL